jgi:hypothetical protein
MSKTKTTEFRRNDVGSWLNGLGQTMPEFKTAGSAGYGVSRQPYYVVQGASRVPVMGFINPKSSDYAAVIGALQGMPVNGIERVGSFDRYDSGAYIVSVGGIDGLDGLLDDAWSKTKSAWGKIGDKVSESKDALVAKAKAVGDYVTDPKQFLNDVINNVPGASATANKVVEALAGAYKKNGELYASIESIKKSKKLGKARPEGWDGIVSQQQKDWAQLTAYAYALYAIPAFATKLRAAGVKPPDISKSYVLAAVQSSTIAKQVYEQVKSRNKTGAVAGLGAEPLSTGALVAISAGTLGVIVGSCYLAEKAASTATAALRGWRDAKEAEALQKAGAKPSEIAAALAQNKKTDIEADKEAGKGGVLPSLVGITSYIPWIIGGVVVVAFLPTLLSLGKAGAAAVEARRAPPALPEAPVMGLGRYRSRSR